MKLEPHLTLVTKINSKWIQDLHIRPETLKLQEENVGKKLDMGLGNDFFDKTPKEHTTKAKINKWDYIKLKNFCTEKEQSVNLKGNRQNE